MSNALKNKSLLFLIILCLVSFKTWALNIAFIYPNGESTPSEAKPTMNAFAEALSQTSQIKIKAEYLNNTKQALKKIKQNKIAIGIISHDFYWLHQNKLAMEKLAQSLAIESNKPTQYYALVASQKRAMIEQIFLSRNLDSSYLTNIVFQNLNPNKIKTYKPTPNILAKLKQIATTHSNTAALLNSFEHTAIQRLNLSWAKKLKTIYQSPPIPSTKVVSFKKLDDPTKQNIQSGLVQMNQSDQGLEILETLRLAGFR